MGSKEERIRYAYKAMKRKSNKRNRGMRVNDRFMYLARIFKTPVKEIKRIVGYDKVPGEAMREEHYVNMLVFSCMSNEEEEMARIELGLKPAAHLLGHGKHSEDIKKFLRGIVESLDIDWDTWYRDLVR